jgi:hypothetical protein
VTSTKIRRQTRLAMEHLADVELKAKEGLNRRFFTVRIIFHFRLF